MADVFIGGVQGFSGLAVASASSLLRATGRVGLYMHGPGVQSSYDNGSLTSIASAFNGTGTGMAELPYVPTNPSSWFSTFYRPLFTDSGLNPSAISVDITSYSVDPSEWSAYVTAAQALGISLVSPIFSPNDPSDPLGDFGTLPAYASLRAAALLGGGITLDTPPSYAFARSSDYLSTVESEIQWARENGVKSTVIVSPTTADYDSSFLEDTAHFIAQLAANNALPDNWVVETYVLDGTTVIGSENDPESIAGVALWIAQNADTPSSIASSSLSQDWDTPLHLDVGASTGTISSTSASSTLNASSTAGRSSSSYSPPPMLSIRDSGGEDYVIGGPGGISYSSTGLFYKFWSLSVL